MEGREKGKAEGRCHELGVRGLPGEMVEILEGGRFKSPRILVGGHIGG